MSYVSVNVQGYCTTSFPLALPIIISQDKLVKHHRFMVDTRPTRTKCFTSSFLIRCAKELNSLPESVSCRVLVFKGQVYILPMGRRAASWVASSLTTRRALGSLDNSLLRTWYLLPWFIIGKQTPLSNQFSRLSVWVIDIIELFLGTRLYGE